MDAPTRLAVLSSHLRPVAPLSGAGNPSVTSCFCASDSRNVQNDCVFCRIIRGESPAFKLYEDGTCLCILDTSPLSHGHSLILPKSHYTSLEATPPSVVASMFSKVPRIGSAIMKATGSDSFNLLVNNGAAAGQVVFHSIPRCPMKFDHRASQLVNSVREQLSNISEDGKGQESTLS